MGSKEILMLEAASHFAVIALVEFAVGAIHFLNTVSL